MLTAIIILVALAQIILSLFVLQRGHKNLTNILFFFLGISTLAWAIANYLTVVFLDSEGLISLVRIILFCVVIQNSFFYLFGRTFPEKSWPHSKKGLVVYGLFTLAAALATLSPYVFTSVEIKDGLPVTQAGPGILVFIAHAAFSIGMAFKSFAKKLKSSRGTVKNQLQLLLIASFLNWVVVPITNFAITPLLKTTVFITIGPIYTLLFASIIAYAIVSQKLFDIRAAVARSVAYLLALGFIGLFYGGFIFLISNLFAASLESDNLQRAIFIGFALISAIFFQPLRGYFDKQTNRLFYRDAYDPQALLDELNQTFVTNIELNVLLRHTTRVVETGLKSEFCFVCVQEKANEPIRIVGNSEPHFTPRELASIFENLTHARADITITEDTANSHLKRLLSKNDIAVAIRLPSGYGDYQSSQAFLLLGPKKSGNLYNSSDLKLLEIISDELMIAIQNALRFEEIQGFAATLQSEVNQATSKLKKTNKKLKALDETKDEFISMASHQLRTPLTSVKGYLSMVLEGDAGQLNKNQRQLLNQAFISSQRMVYLIADLLNVSRLKTGKFVIDVHPTNLAEVVEGEISQLTEVAKGKKLTLTYKKPQNFPTLLLDETKIRQVIMNFADNAIYYTPSGGKVVIELKEDKNNIYFLVKDNGLGVPKDEQKKLFTKFYRARNARKARPDGTGLGLFMAKKVVNAQGGDILFESHEGKGSTFGFTFSKKKLSLKA